MASSYSTFSGRAFDNLADLAFGRYNFAVYFFIYFNYQSFEHFFERTRYGFDDCQFAFFSLHFCHFWSLRQVIPSFVQTPEFTKTIQIVGSYNIALLLVGLLASRLSDRHASGEELKETLKSLADLRVLHERIIESIRSGLITTDLDGIIYTFNAAASEITGHQAEEMNGKSIFSLFGNIQLPIADSLEATDTGDHPPRFETDCMTPDGFAVHVGYNISPLFAKDGETTGLIISFQDLTEIRSMEENVRRKDRLAAVGRVAAGLAHEIRNPLGAMRGAIQVLQSQHAARNFAGFVDGNYSARIGPAE